MVQDSLKIGHKILHYPMSSAERAERAVRSKRMSERCERTSERTSEWPGTYVPITSLSEPPCDGFSEFPSQFSFQIQRLSRAGFLYPIQS